MGDRGQVFIPSTGVYLYTHWGASELPEVVQEALARHERWDDDEYLTRMIFSKMVEGDIGGATGYGVGTQKHGDVWRVVTVDTREKTVDVEDGSGGGRKYSFEDFAKRGDFMEGERAARMKKFEEGKRKNGGRLEA